MPGGMKSQQHVIDYEVTAVSNMPGGMKSQQHVIDRFMRSQQ